MHYKAEHSQAARMNLSSLSLIQHQGKQIIDIVGRLGGASYVLITSMPWLASHAGLCLRRGCKPQAPHADFQLLWREQLLLGKQGGGDEGGGLPSRSCSVEQSWQEMRGTSCSERSCSNFLQSNGELSKETQHTKSQLLPSRLFQVRSSWVLLCTLGEHKQEATLPHHHLSMPQVWSQPSHVGGGFFPLGFIWGIRTTLGNHPEMD